MPTNKQYWTAQQIIDRVKDELDLQEETFIDDVEMVRYCNAAIDRAEQQVIGIHKDYFLSSARLLSSLGYEQPTEIAPGGSVTLVGGWPPEVLVGDEVSFQNESHDTRYKILSFNGNEAIVAGEPTVGVAVSTRFYLVGLRSQVREYSLPEDIYAHKIRRIMYENGSQVYKVNRIRDWKKFERKALEDVNNSATLLEYFPVNRIPGQPKIQFVPKPSETGDYITIWYCRQANRFDDSYTGPLSNRVLSTPLDDPTNILDIPEAFNYIVEFVKMKCDIKEKRNMGQIQTGDYPEVMVEYKEFIGVIQEMIPDGDNEIEADFSSYEEHS
jgi:hypothetical protein